MNPTDTPMGRIMGKWPGDETDEQIKEGLQMLNDRKNITQPTDWWAAFEAQAKAEGISLAEWLGECGKANLPKGVAEKLSERGTRGRPAKHNP